MRTGIHIGISSLTALFFTFVVCIGDVSAQHPRYMGEAMFEGTMDDFQMGNYAKAVEGFKKFLELAPNDFNGHYLLAHSLRFLGRSDEAIEYYEKALTIKPNDYDAHIYVGVLYRDSGDFEKAEAHFSRAREIIPNDPEAVVNIGMVKRQSGDIAGALVLFEEAVRLDAESIDAYIWIAETYCESGDRANSYAWIRKAQKHAPDSFDVLIEAGTIDFKFDNLDSAMTFFEKARILKPELPLPLDKLAEVCDKKGLTEKAREYREQAAALVSTKKK